MTDSPGLETEIQSQRQRLFASVTTPRLYCVYINRQRSLSLVGVGVRRIRLSQIPEVSKFPDLDPVTSRSEPWSSRGSVEASRVRVGWDPSSD